MNTYDHLIKSGRVIDPANNIDGIMDVAITSGKIAAVEADLATLQPEAPVENEGRAVEQHGPAAQFGLAHGAAGVEVEPPLGREG